MRTRIILTVILLFVAVLGLLLFARPALAPGGYAPQDDDPVALVFAPNTQRPLIVTRAGALLEPAGDRWQAVKLDAQVYDVYSSADGTLYAGTATGLLSRRDGNWQTVENIPPTRQLAAMHGFLFAFGDQGVARTTQGEDEDNQWRMLDMPAPEQPARHLVMLADHSHVVLNDDLQQTHDMGLSWERMASPQGVRMIAADPQARLLGLTNTGVARWLDGDRWEEIAPLPNGVMPDMIQTFDEQLYALAAGDLLRLEGDRWRVIPVGDGESYLTALAVHQLRTLWLADALTRTLWTTTDLESWTAIRIEP